MTPKDKQLSKLISLLLRHDPGAADLTLDVHGWITVDELCAGLAGQGGPACDLATIERLMADGDKPRWELSADRARVRATHGHSVELEHDHAPATPPERLYHGTVARFWEAIRTQGLVPGQRRFVHLSEASAAAAEVARRRGKPVILVVDAAAMQRAGHVFYNSQGNIWLTAHVPPEFLVVAP